MMELTEEVKELLNTAKDLKGSVRRMFMARKVQTLGKGGQRLVELVTMFQTGVKSTKQAMQALKTQFQHLLHLDKWFVDINYPLPATGMDNNS